MFAGRIRRTVTKDHGGKRGTRPHDSRRFLSFFFRIAFPSESELDAQDVNYVIYVNVQWGRTQFESAGSCAWTGSSASGRGKRNGQRQPGLRWFFPNAESCPLKALAESASEKTK